MRVLIVEDGFSRGALAAVRSLGRAGAHVGVASPARGLAARSKHAAAWHRVDSAALTAGVAGAVAVERYEIVLPAGDPETLTLSEQRSQLGALFPYATHETVVRTFDKVCLAEAAARTGLSTPRVGDAAELRPPLIVKPRLRARIPLGPAVAPTRESAQQLADDLAAEGIEPVVQEYVSGRLAASFLVVDERGDAHAEGYQVADEIWPRAAGGSVRAATAAADPQLRERVHALLRELGWLGLAQVQFIIAADGKPQLLDVNGRLYGSIALAIAAGADLPRAWVELALTGRTSVGSARPGVRYHALEGDLLRALSERRVAPLAATARYTVGAVGSIWDARDPAPGALHLRRLASRVRRRLTARRTGA